MVKTRSLYLTWAWYMVYANLQCSTLSPGRDTPDRQTDRQTDRQNSHS